MAEETPPGREPGRRKAKIKAKKSHLRSTEQFPGGGMIFTSEHLLLWDWGWELTCEQRGS